MGQRRNMHEHRGGESLTDLIAMMRRLRIRSFEKVKSWGKDKHVGRPVWITRRGKAECCDFICLTVCFLVLPFFFLFVCQLYTTPSYMRESASGLASE